MALKDLLGEANAKYAQATTLLREGVDAEHIQQAEGLIQEAKAIQGRCASAQSLLAQIPEAVGMVEQEGVQKFGRQPVSSGSFSDMGEFLFHVWRASNPLLHQPPDSRLVWHKDEGKPREAKDMNEGTGSAGGFLVPTEERTSLMSVAGESAIVRPRATIIRMARRSVTMPVLDQTETTAGRPHWFGGMRFYWEEEAGEKTETDPKFKKIELTAYKLIGYTRASDELVDDAAISLADFFNGPFGFVGGLTWMEDIAFINGTGVGQPLGVLKSGATISVARQQDNPLVSFEDFANMYQHLLPSANAVWVINIGLMSDIITMNGPSGNPMYVWVPNAANGIPGTILGLPVIWTEKLPAPGQAGDVLLADFRYYLVGDRQATTVESTKFDKWAFDQTSWRAVHRVDGQPWLSAPLTLQDGSTTISPFVILGQKSS